jgi:hypothetical protein
MRHLFFLILLIPWIFSASAFAQADDSLKIYKKIKKIAARHKLTRVAYEAVFRDPEPKEYPAVPEVSEGRQVNPYLKVQGAVVRHIKVQVYDPFGYSVNDTVPGKINSVQSAGNRLHIRTRRFIVMNRLLFKENERVEALKLSESERLLRAAVFVNDARILVTKVAADTVDVTVVVHDKWPITVPAEITDQNANAQFRNNNLFGWGQQFEQYVKVYRDQTYLVKGFYNISNIDNTYISSSLGYNTTIDETNLYLNFDKPFYSFLATWAGGINVNHAWRSFSYFDTVSQTGGKIPLNVLSYDVWAGKLVKVSNRKTLFNESTNLILGARYYSSVFLNRPASSIDTGRIFLNSSAALGNVGFAVQQYYKDKYIYRFGANEDVPEGLVIQFTYGVLQREENKLRFYNGIEVARAKHFNFGYLSATLSYGIFYNVNVPNDVTTNYNLQYFSELLRKGRWYFREFLYFNLLHGENKIQKQTITLTGSDLYGFRSGDLTGNTKMVLNSETVAYMPYKFIGFKFAPVMMVGLGMLGDPENPLVQSRLFQAYSVGLMLRNENLLTSTFQISFGLYPFFPDKRGLTAIYNPVTSFTIKVRGFAIGRPEFISY